MTRGEGGNPETYSGVTIEKFSGMNTNSPRGVFGQPNWLENIVLDRRGGYACAPSPELVYNFGNPIKRMTPLNGERLILVQTTGGTFAFDTENTETTSPYADVLPEIESYGQGTAISWDVNDPQNGVRADVLLSADVSGRVDMVIKHAITLDFEEIPGQVTPGSNSQGYYYPAGSLYGFDPNQAHYLILYIQSGSVFEPPAEGTTLNPLPPFPNIIRPIIVKLDRNPKGFQRHYKVIINNPQGRLTYAYGASRPETRTFNEYFNSYGAYVWGQFSGVVEVGWLVKKNPRVQASRSGSDEYVIRENVYQALTRGNIGPIEPQWPEGIGSTVQDNGVTWMNVGIREPSEMSFAEYISRTGNPPADYVPPTQEFRARGVDYGQWDQLELIANSGDRVEVYRSRASRPNLNFIPSSFFPAGHIIERHLGRTWVVPDAVWRSYAGDAGPSLGPHTQDIESPLWETAKYRRTVYYSEPDQPYRFLERFITMPASKSRNIQAMRSIGDYLLILGDSDALAVMGDTEANFYVRAIDIPGAFNQETTVVYSGVLYYWGVGGLYRLNGGRAEKISLPVADLVPDVPGPGASITTDPRFDRILFRVSDALILCYDIPSDGWTVLNTPGTLFRVGNLPYIAQNEKLYSLTGKPDRVANISYRDFDAGMPQYRKRFMSINCTVEASSIGASIALSTQVHRPDAAVSGFSTQKEEAVSQRTRYVQWRTPNRVGYSLDFDLTIKPGNGDFLIKPGINIELYKEAVIRKGY